MPTPITRATATKEQLAAEAKTRFEQLKKFEKFDLDAKNEEIEKVKEKLAKLEGEVDAYFDFLGIPKAPEPAAASSSGGVKKGGAKKASGEGFSIPLADLKSALENFPQKTADIRKQGWEIANIKTLAAANPHLLKIIASGPWPKVQLLK